MLAQSFKSAADLGITEPQRDALRKTLVLLETGKLRHVPLKYWDDLEPMARTFTGHFNMNYWGNHHACGTVACIGGTASIVGNVEFADMPRALDDLFYPNALNSTAWADITTAQAATALRSYLTTGNANWAEAVA